MNKRVLTVLSLTVVFLGIQSTPVWAVRNPFIPQLPLPEIPQPVVKNHSASQSTQRNSSQSTQSTATAQFSDVQQRERALPEFNLKGIVWGTDRPQVIINDQVLDVGATFMEITITGIYKKSIEIEFDGRTISLPL